MTWVPGIRNTGEMKNKNEMIRRSGRGDGLCSQMSWLEILALVRSNSVTSGKSTAPSASVSLSVKGTNNSSRLLGRLGS